MNIKKALICLLTDRPFFLIIPAFLLLIAPANLPYYYYSILRVLVFLACGWVLFITHELDQDKNSALIIRVLAALIAFVFNPVVPIHLAKTAWVVIDLVCAVYFSALVFIKLED